MKKFLALFLTAALLLAMLGACSADNPGNTNPPDPTAGASATVPPTDNTQEPSVGLPSAEPADEPTDQPTDEPTDQPTDEPTGEPTQTPESDPPATNPPATNPPATNPPATNPPATDPPVTDPPATNPPVTDPPATDPPASDPPASNPPGIPGFGGVVIPGLGGPTGPTGPTGPSQPGGDTETPVEPTGPSASDINLEEFFWTIADKYDFPGMDVLPTEFIIQLFPGLASIPAVQRVVAIKGTTPTDMEVVLIQVSNSSDLSKVEEIFGNRIQYLLTTQGNYPSVVKNWTNYVQIVNRGNYIMLVVHENYDAIVSDFIALF